MISYLLPAAGSTVNACANIASHITILKNTEGKVYWPAFGINNITAMQPGEGYYLYMNAADTLKYPATAKVRELAPVSINIPQHFNPPASTGSNASLLFNKVSFNNRVVPDNSEVGVFDNSGILVGSGTVVNGAAVCTVWGDDPITPVKDGCAAGENLTCKLWMNTTEYPLTFTGTPSSAVYSDNGIVTGSLSAQMLSGITGFSFTEAYPNPFTKNIRLSFNVPSINGASLHKVDIAIYTLNGVLVSKAASGMYAAGSHSVSWDAGTPGSNVYIAVMKSGSFCAKMRLFKVR